MNTHTALQRNTVTYHGGDSYAYDDVIPALLDVAPMVERSGVAAMLRELNEMQEALDEIAQCVIY